jgi:hypothetical protein
MTIFIKRSLISIILIFSAACQQTLVAVQPVLPPTQAPLVAATARPTLTPQPIDLPIKTVTSTQPPIPTLFPSASPMILLPPPQVTNLIEVTPATTSAPVIETFIPAGNTFVVGQSVQGRDILAWRFGDGAKVVLVVGGIHAGFEANTVMLVNELITHFQGTPADVLPGITLILIPVANPDGLIIGREAAGRFNANNVDLNRNWGCEWSATAYWQNRLVNPGASAFSEPETRAIGQLIRDMRPGAAVFYHAAARGVFAGGCDGDHGSGALAAVIGEASGYPYGEAWSAYPVSGTAATWADGLGVPAVDLELSGTRETEFLPNLRGIMAIQAWLTAGT